MGKAKILIVDDELITTIALTMYLQRFGYAVCEPVCSANEVIKAIEQEHPDLVLMDVNLGGGHFDGIEIARQIHACFGIPIAFISAYSPQELEKHTDKIEPVGYFTKPFDYQNMQNTLAAVFENQTKDVP